MPPEVVRRMDDRLSPPVGVLGPVAPPGPISRSKTLSRPAHHSRYLPEYQGIDVKPIISVRSLHFITTI